MLDSRLLGNDNAMSGGCFNVAEVSRFGQKRGDVDRPAVHLAKGLSCHCCSTLLFQICWFVHFLS